MAQTDAERAEIELRTALVHYRQGESLAPRKSSSFTGRRKAPEKLKLNATFDAALAALNRHNYETSSRITAT